MVTAPVIKDFDDLSWKKKKWCTQTLITRQLKTKEKELLKKLVNLFHELRKENQETYTFLASPSISPSSVLSFGCLCFLLFPGSSSVAPSLEEELDTEEFGVDGVY
jgi:hypothetical protein